MPFHVVWNIYLPQGMTGSIPTRLLTDETVLSVERTSYDRFLVTMIASAVELPACLATDRPLVGFLYFIDGSARTAIRDEHMFLRKLNGTLEEEQYGDGTVAMSVHEPNPETFVEPDDFDEILNGRDTPPNRAIQALFESSSHGISQEAQEQLLGVETAPNDFNHILVNAINQTLGVPLWRDPDPNSDDGADLTVPAGTLCRREGDNPDFTGLAAVVILGWSGVFYTPTMHVHQGQGWPIHLARPVDNEQIWPDSEELPGTITELDHPQVFEVDGQYQDLLPGNLYESRRIRVASTGNTDFWLETNNGGMWVPSAVILRRGSFTEIDLWYRLRTPHENLELDVPYNGIAQYESDDVMSIRLVDGASHLWVPLSDLIHIEGTHVLLQDEDGNVPYWEDRNALSTITREFDWSNLSAFILPDGTLPSGIEVALAGPLTNEAGTLISYGGMVVLVPSSSVRLPPLERSPIIMQARVTNEGLLRSAPFWDPTADTQRDMSSGQIDVGLVVDVIGSAPGRFCVVRLVDGRDVFMRDVNLTEVTDSPQAPRPIQVGQRAKIISYETSQSEVAVWLRDGQELYPTMLQVGLQVTIVSPLSLSPNQTVCRIPDGRTVIVDNANLDGMPPVAPRPVASPKPRTIYDRLNEDES